MAILYTLGSAGLLSVAMVVAANLVGATSGGDAGLRGLLIVVAAVVAAAILFADAIRLFRTAREARARQIPAPVRVEVPRARRRRMPR